MVFLHVFYPKDDLLGHLSELFNQLFDRDRVSLEERKLPHQLAYHLHGELSAELVEIQRQQTGADVVSEDLFHAKLLENFSVLLTVWYVDENDIDVEFGLVGRQLLLQSLGIHDDLFA